MFDFVRKHNRLFLGLILLGVSLTQGGFAPLWRRWRPATQST